ncbi:T9SS type A sorting domain-containing protein [Flavobacterium algicola]|uniref:T9SS type A sorting domain-containing protein n=1 Tax=Flavobacterium algicola TaxID=556529 RepID=UPI001EFDFA7E|nr:T9SS type A sorting domain-containing protein [Flavobacterium algicola]MCG9794193.1 T9SS type A sorting domain-containing protein [Flavobacterium algicola]
MRELKKIIFSIVMLSFAMMQSQTITFNGCHNLFDDQNFIFNYAGTDETGRNFYKTTPVDGLQDCGGLGTCEFMLKYNVVTASWEFIADSGNGDFTDTFLIYSNSSASLPKPPDVNLGNWVENASLTGAKCGGNLTSVNAILSGDVQSTTLGTNSIVTNNKFVVYPNPVNDVLHFASTTSLIENVAVMNVQGQRVINTTSSNSEVNVSKLEKGVYFLNLKSKEGISVYKFVKE